MWERVKWGVGRGSGCWREVGAVGKDGTRETIQWGKVG